MRNTMFAVLAALMFYHPAHAWWSRAHIAVADRALAQCPPGVQAWFGPYRQELLDHTDDSDHIRIKTKHTHDWLDVEALEPYPFEGIPASRQEAYEKYGRDYLETKMGTLPWQASDEYAAMEKAFRQGDPASLVITAAYLAHHIADAHMPLHVTLNYNGEPVGTKGVHIRYEKAVDRALPPAEALSGSVKVPRGFKPFAQMMHIIRRSYDRIFPILYWDAVAVKELGDGADNDSRTAGYEALIMDKLGPLTGLCLEDAARELALFFTAAWEQAGKPDAPAETVKINWPAVE